MLKKSAWRRKKYSFAKLFSIVLRVYVRLRKWIQPVPRRNTGWECSEGCREEDGARADLYIPQLILKARKVCPMEGLKDIWVRSRWSVRSVSKPNPSYDSVTVPELDSLSQRDVLGLIQGYHTQTSLGLPVPIAAEQTPEHRSQGYPRVVKGLRKALYNVHGSSCNIHHLASMFHQFSITDHP